MGSKTQISQNTMSDAEVKNDVAAEAPTAEELKAQKRSAEDDDVDVKKQKVENGKDEEDIDGEEEEDLDGEGEEELDEEDGGEDDEEGEEEEGEGEEEEGE